MPKRTQINAPLALPPAPLTEELPPSGAEPQLSEGRKYWWTGTEWIPSEDSPEAQKAINALLNIPMIEPLPAPDPAKHTVLVPRQQVIAQEAPKVAEPEPEPDEPMPEHWADLAAPPADTIAPEGVQAIARVHYVESVQQTWRDLDRFAAGAVAVAVLLVWLPLVAGVLAMGLALVSMARAVRYEQGRLPRLAIAGLVIGALQISFFTVHHVQATHAAAARAHVQQVLNERLNDVKLFEDTAYTYNSRYAGPIGLAKFGYVPSTDATVTITKVAKFEYCLTATFKGKTLTLTPTAGISTVPC